MNYERHGSGKPLLLVHGLGSSLRNWDPVVPALAAEREIVAVDLPGFGATPPLEGPVTVATLTDAVEHFVESEGLAGVDIIGSSMGARMVLEMARRGHAGTTVALDPGGFWTDRQLTLFGASIKASVALVRSIQPALPALTRTAAGRTALLAQFSAKPWKLDADLVLTELRGFKTARSLDEALASLIHGPGSRAPPPARSPGKSSSGGDARTGSRCPARRRRPAPCSPMPPSTGSTPAGTSPTGTSRPRRHI